MAESVDETENGLGEVIDGVSAILYESQTAEHLVTDKFNKMTSLISRMSFDTFADLGKLFHKDSKVTKNLIKYKSYNESMLPQHIRFIDQHLDDKGLLIIFEDILTNLNYLQEELNVLPNMFDSHNSQLSSYDDWLRFMDDINVSFSSLLKEVKSIVKLLKTKTIGNMQAVVEEEVAAEPNDDKNVTEEVTDSQKINLALFCSVARGSIHILQYITEASCQIINSYGKSN